MFFVTYLRRELRRRMRQSVFIVLGLALGVGLVVTVMAVSSGMQQAQGGVLQGLYGIGTDLTVTKSPPAFTPSSNNGFRITMTPSGAQVCDNGKCSSGAQTIDNLNGLSYGPLPYSTIAKIATLGRVQSAGGGLVLTDQQMTVPATVASGGSLPTSTSFYVDGVDFAHSALGPYTDGKVASGRGFGSGDASANVAVVDSNYASAHSLKVGSTVTVAKTAFKVVGLVAQPQGSQPPDVYIPLARAQALATSQGKGLAGEVNSIYVSAASAADIPAVQAEISKLLPSATVTSPSSLANQVTGSLANTARLTSSLGRWLAVLVLVTAFAVASLLTIAAVTRRVREFGTLKALGWRSRRVIAQVMGESAVIGLVGGVIGVGVGFAGSAVIKAIAPKLSATVVTSTGQHLVSASPSGSTSYDPTISRTVPIIMTAPVTTDAILLAVVLAVFGALLAGSLGSWRIAQLRPADALARVA
jgi:putative ABC transport system permease protein